LSLRHLEEMMAERGISVDHSTVHRWAIKLLPVLEKAFRRSKRKVGRSWRMDETYSTPSQRSPACMGVMLLEHVWNAALDST
jgi:transposase-like protein